MYRKNVAGQFLCFGLVNASTGAALASATVTVRRCIDGTFAAGGGTVTEDSGGLYKYALAQADTNGNDLSFYFTATNAIPVCINVLTTACDPSVATNFGITGIPAVASGSAGALLVDGTGTAAISNSSGKVLLQSTGLASVTAWTVAITGNITGALSGTVGGIAGTTQTLDTLQTALNSTHGAGSWATATSVTVSDKTGFSLATTQTFDNTGTWTGNLVGTVSLVTAVTGLTASNLDATVSSRLASASYTSPPSAVAISSQITTDHGTGSYVTATGFAVAGDAMALTPTYGAAGHVEVNIKYVNGTSVTGSGTSGSPWGP